MISEKSAYARIRTHASPRRGHILKMCTKKRLLRVFFNFIFLIFLGFRRGYPYWYLAPTGIPKPLDFNSANFSLSILKFSSASLILFSKSLID